jgi:hypothetical protein
MYRFDNGWEWRRVTSSQQMDHIEPRFSPFASVPEERTGDELAYLRDAYGHPRNAPIFVLYDGPAPTGQALALIGIEGYWLIDHFDLLGLTLWPRNAQGKVDTASPHGKARALLEQIKGAVLALLDWLQISPDAMKNSVRKRLGVPYIVPDLTAFIALGVPDAEFIESIKQAKDAQVLGEISWNAESELAFEIRAYENGVIWALNQGLGDLGDGPYHSPSAMRTESGNVWRWWWQGDRIDQVVGATFDRATGDLVFDVRHYSDSHSGPNLAQLLVDMGIVQDLTWWNNQLDSHALPGHPLVDLEPYELLDETPPPLLLLQPLREWARLPAGPKPSR